MAILVAKELGISLEEISKACQKIKPLSGAMKLIKTKSKLNIIDATYSANPNGVISHLEHLKLWKGKKIIIMPCLIELGAKSSAVHQEIGKKIAEICDLSIITKKECLSDIKKGASLLGKGNQIKFSNDPVKIYEEIKSFSGKEDIILLESRVPNEILNLLKKDEDKYL